jgi:hypothetical protein
MPKKRKYDESYVLYDFTCIHESDGTQKPQCLLRLKILANRSTEWAKLKEHLTSVHPEKHLKMRFFFCEDSSNRKTGTHKKLEFAFWQKPFLEASCKCVYRIAKQKKAHTTGERAGLWTGTEEKLEAVPLSNDVIRSRRVDTAFNILRNVMPRHSYSLSSKVRSIRSWPFLMKPGFTCKDTKIRKVIASGVHRIQI